MKMAKANRSDMEAAMAMCSAMDSLSRGYLPEALTNPGDEADERYDERKHAAKVVEHLVEIASRGSLFRVCFGMTVILDPRNEIVDPDADTLEAHPKFEKVAQHREKLLAALKELRPEFGAVGSRDVDVKTAQERIDALVAEVEFA